MAGFFKEISAKIYSRLFFYPTLLFSYMNRSQTRHWFDRIDNQVILGALPLRTFVPQLEDEGVGGVLSMNEHFETRYTILSREEWARRGIEQQQLPTVDFFRAPTQTDIHRGIDFIKEIGREGKSTYVHCKAGRGRSTTVVTCYLMQLHGISPDEAVTRIREKRSHINMCGEQMQAVRIFYRDNVMQK